MMSIFAFSVFAHGEGGDAKVGKGYAVEEYDAQKGFKLSKKASKRLRLSYANPLEKIPSSAIVKTTEGKGVMVFRDGFYNFTLLDNAKFKKGDKVVKSKVSMLRAIEAEAKSSLAHQDEEVRPHKKADSHGHGKKKHAHGKGDKPHAH